MATLPARIRSMEGIRLPGSSETPRSERTTRLVDVERRRPKNPEPFLEPRRMPDPSGMSWVSSHGSVTGLPLLVEQPMPGLHSDFTQRSHPERYAGCVQRADGPGACCRNDQIRMQRHMLKQC